MKTIAQPFAAKSVGIVFRALALTPVFLSPYALALTTIGAGQTENIDAGTATDNYLVQNGGTLNTSGATTNEVILQNNSTLNATGGEFHGSSSNSTPGITVTNSQGTIRGALITGVLSGMEVNRLAGTTTGSNVVVSGSQIIGGTAGVAVTGGSTLQLVNTQVTATGSNSAGLVYSGGDVSLTGSQVSGGANGIFMQPDGEGVGADTNRLVLNNSTVEGRSGAAILVGNGLDANIDILNGSTLTGGNGNILEVEGASTANVNVANSALTGNVDVTGNSTANLSFNGAQMTGDFNVEAGSTGNLALANGSLFKGSLTNVDGVTINSGSQWEMTASNTVGTLAMDNGTVTMGQGSNFYQLDVGSLAGNGTFAMNVDFATNQHDVLNVTGASSGDFKLLVAGSGVDPVSPEALTLVHTASGNASFALAGAGLVDVGTYSYGLGSSSNGSGGTDWFLDPSQKTISPSTQSVLALFNTAPTVWYGELTSLRTRMGELRFNDGQSGSWARAYGNKYNVSESSGVGYSQNQQGFTLGADAPLPMGDGHWLIGAMAGHSNSDLDLKGGTTGNVKSYYVGGYTTWLEPETGYYFDGVVKLNRFENESKVAMSDGTQSKGSYGNTGLGGSAEFGRHIKLDNDFFVEPFGQLSAVVIQGKNYNLDNGLQAEGDQTRSFLGKVGTTVGRNLTLESGTVVQPYLKAAVAHEFAKNNDVKVNNTVFNNDLSGSRAEFGAGVAVKLSKDLQVHADFDYANGKSIEQPFGANVGLRYSW
ncbi:autotransporter outer membrane beta-barrel domain-containing protein [Pseudomonas gingeri]|uniref:Autotransporter outer membrane beta-barrel domain-containing protein n=1 Tax=Pseudomonas gingeri TaxID=117681 RepID=A0A7Y7XJ65_9PSED|nr:autotransporter outer membrane beta-barrel domain-containing protein [Pseudomonas gingeri]NWC00492.1 autotransporter outer membrane beta-barrel domain-containing protein [Pseudomonas gingeri]